MESLSEGIVEDILIRLPEDSLMCCKCVSKQWLNLISKPHFVKLHLKKSKAKEQCKLIIVSPPDPCFSLKYIEKYTAWVEDYEFYGPINLDEDKVVRTLGSCDGLLLLFTSDREMFLWNPTTQQVKKVPGGSIRRTGYHRELSGIDYYCCGYFPLYGFGYDESTDDYKVVSHGNKTNKKMNNLKSEVYVYTLRKDSWRVVKTKFPCLSYGSEKPGVLVDGILHWTVCPHERSCYSTSIVSFDLRSEEFRGISPPKFETGMKACEVGILGGHLCTLQYYDNSYVDVWAMKDYGIVESWTKLFRFKDHRDRGISRLKLLQILRNGDILLVRNSTDLVMYDSQRQRQKSVNNMDFFFYGDVETYVKSLVSLEAENGLKRKANRSKKISSKKR